MQHSMISTLLAAVSLRDLALAQAVHRHASFNRAARAMHISPSGLSHQVQKVEQALGVPLFERGGRSIVPTAAGTRLLAQIEAILDSLQILALDVPADTEYAGIRAELEAAGKPIGPNDWFIAAHAYALEAVLVTANITDFSRIRALKVENWITDLH